MKRQLFCAIIALVGLCMATPATAQITIDKVETKEETISFRDTMKRSDTSTEYFSLARYKAERAAIRKERNTLELTTGVMATLTQYNDPWVDVSGGDNSIATTANVFFQHVFTKDRFSIETKFEGKFGYNRMKVRRAVWTRTGKRSSTAKASGSRIRMSSISTSLRRGRWPKTGPMVVV